MVLTRRIVNDFCVDNTIFEWHGIVWRGPSKLDEKVRNAIIRPKFKENQFLMKISAHEEYGLRCLVQLARAETDGESLTLNQIGEREGLSVGNAGKFMWILVKAGLVQSQRGASGGYTLARPA